MRIILLFISLLFIVSCSPEKRVNRLIKKVEKISDKNGLSIHTKDTIYHKEVFYEVDTFFIDSSEISKTFNIKDLAQKQFFVIEDEKVKTTVTLLPPTRFRPGKIDLKTKIKPDTIYNFDTIEIDVPTYIDRKIFVKEYKPKWYDWILRILFLLLITWGAAKVYASR